MLEAYSRKNAKAISVVRESLTTKSRTRPLTRRTSANARDDKSVADKRLGTSVKNGVRNEEMVTNLFMQYVFSNFVSV